MGPGLRAAQHLTLLTRVRHAVLGRGAQGERSSSGVQPCCEEEHDRPIDALDLVSHSIERHR
ncbi:MAG: hypothetical protein M1126_06725 [Candidatus Thermoplasmatota archaeon]|nr:hypothetical protein [Candidatus Thermoplasmatota archaeon]